MKSKIRISLESYSMSPLIIHCDIELRSSL